MNADKTRNHEVYSHGREKEKKTIKFMRFIFDTPLAHSKHKNGKYVIQYFVFFESSPPLEENKARNIASPTKLRVDRL